MRKPSSIAPLTVILILGFAHSFSLAQSPTTGPADSILSSLKKRPRVDKPAANTPQRQAIAKALAAAEPLAMQYKARIDSGPLPMQPLPELHKVAFAAARHGHGALAERLASAEQLASCNLILLAHAVEAFEMSGESIRASELAVKVAKQMLERRAEYEGKYGVNYQVRNELQKLVFGRGVVRDADAASSIIRQYPADEQALLIDMLAQGFAKGGDEENALLILSKTLPPKCQQHRSMQRLDPNRDAFSQQERWWADDCWLPSSLSGETRLAIAIALEHVPNLSIVMLLGEAGTKHGRGDKPGARAELEKAIKVVDAGTVAPAQPLPEGYRFAALMRIAELALNFDDRELAQAATARAAKIAVQTQSQSRNGILSRVAIMQALVRDEQGLKETIATWSADPATTWTPAQMEAHARGLADQQAQMKQREREWIWNLSTRPAAAKPATRPAVNPAAVDAEIAGILKSQDPTETKMVRLIQLADAIAQ